MRPITPDLRSHIQCVDPDARMFVEVDKEEAAHIRRRKEQWEEATTHGGLFTIFDDGGVRNIGTNGTLAVHAASNSTLTDLDQLDPRFVIQLQWNGTHSPDVPLYELTVRLDSDADGESGKNVDKWVAQFYALANEQTVAKGRFGFPDTTLILPRLTLIALTQAIEVTAGPSAADVSFQFAQSSFKPTPKAYRPSTDASGASAANPRTYVFIWAIDAEGDPATNVAMLVDNAEGTSKVTNGNTLSQRKLAKLSSTDGSTNVYDDLGNVSGVPHCEWKTKTYVTRTLEFNVDGNQFDLGAAPVGGDVELVLTGDRPGGSTLQGQVRNDANTGWVNFTDGQLMNGDLGLTPTKTRKLQVVFTPNAAADVAPILRELGIRDTTITDISDIADVRDMGAEFDVVSLKQRITEAQIVVLRGGEPGDYTDPFADVLVVTDLAKLKIRVLVGHASLAREEWLHMNTFTIDDVSHIPGAYVLHCVSPLSLLKKRLPVFFGTTVTAIEYENSGLKTTYDDLFDGRLGVAARYAGPRPTDDATLLTKIIRDSDGKVELDAVAFIDGSVNIDSQAQIKAIKVHGSDAPVVRVFPKEELHALNVSSGYRARLPDVRVNYGYDEERRDFKLEARGFHGPAITALGDNRIDPHEVDEEVERYIPTLALAKTVAQRQVDSFGPGLLLWEFQTTYAHPELELGDPIAVETDLFVAKDPIQVRAIRGVVWAFGIVAGIRDPWARRFLVWIPTYSNLLSGSTALTRLGFALPEVVSIVPENDIAGNVSAIVTVRDALSVRVAGSNSAFPSLATTQVAARVATAGASALTGTLATIHTGQTAFITALAYENADGTGAESTILSKAEHVGAGAILDTAPTVDISFDSWGSSLFQVDITATRGNGGTGTLQVRYRAKVNDADFVAWSSWLTSPENNVTFPVDPLDTVTMQVQARDTNHPHLVGDVGVGVWDSEIKEWTFSGDISALSREDGNTIVTGAIIAAERFTATRVALGDAVSPTTGVSLKIGSNHSGNGFRQLSIEGKLTATANDQINHIAARVDTELAKGGFTGLDYTAFFVDADLSGSGTVTNYYGAFLSDPSLPAGALTNSYGLYIPDRAVGTNTWAIYTNLGKVRFGDAVTIVGQASPLLKLDQGGQDGDILRLISSDVAHGITSIIPTDAYARFRKFSSVSGGLQIAGFSESGMVVGTEIAGFAGSQTTTKSASAKAAVMVHGERKIGTTLANLDSGANIFGVTMGGNSTRLLVGSDGEVHIDGANYNTSVWDEHDDLALARGFRASLLPPGHAYRERFWRFAEYARPILEASGVVTYNADGHHFIALGALGKFTLDLVLQEGYLARQRTRALELRLETLEQETLWQTLRRRLRARSSASLPMSSAV